MRKSVLRLAGWRAASWAETAAVPRVAGAMAKREVAKARGRATAAEEGALAALTEATQSSPLVPPRFYRYVCQHGASASLVFVLQFRLVGRTLGAGPG